MMKKGITLRLLIDYHVKGEGILYGSPPPFFFLFYRIHVSSALERGLAKQDAKAFPIIYYFRI